MTGFVVQGHILTFLWELIILIIEKHQNVLLDHHSFILFLKCSNYLNTVIHRILLKIMFNASTAKKMNT